MFLQYSLLLLSACAASVALCRLVMTARLMDGPSAAHKVQQKAVPSSGGLGFVLAIALVLSPILSASATSETLVLGAGILGLTLIGLVDDLQDMNAKMKLALQLAVIFAMAWFGVRAEVIEPGFDKVRDFGLIGGLIFSTAWFVLLINAVNFMDGSNGMAMGLAMFACIGFAGVFGFVGEWEMFALSLAAVGALAGFLVWNMQGCLFAGDAGSLAIGGLLGGLSLMLVKARPDLVFIPPILLSPFLVDVLLTLNYRVRRGDDLFEAHRDHVYQLGLKPPLELKHWQVAIGHWMIAANCAALAFAATIIGYVAPLVVFAGVTLLGCWMHIRIRRAAIAVAEMEAAKSIEAEQAS